ncbi:MAG TPA: ABC transporter permease [Flavitalea sp.]|nr:ABC transporter permease [Flavitalea sp.]
MIRNYLRTAWRNLLKNKVFSFINILGLTIGITACMLIFLFIVHEFSMDSMHARGKNIYRVMRQFDKNKNPAPYLSGPYADALLNDYPGEIREAVRVMASDGLITFDNKAFREKKLYAADEGFFTLFSFPFVAGDPKTVLKDPSGIVISESTAKKYFGNQDPMGKILVLDKRRDLKVTGVFRDIPSTSHLDFDIVYPLSNYYKEPWFKIWMNNNFFVYVLLDPKNSPVALEKKFPQFMDKYMKQEMIKLGSQFSLTLKPLSDIYFESDSGFDNVKHGDLRVVHIFISIAVLILLIGCINFINLATIRAVERSKEVGLRKVLGALRKQLMMQFVGESMLLTVISIVLSIALFYLVRPAYSDLLGYPIALSWNSLPIYLFFLGIIIVVGFLAGSYPAIFLSGFSPIEALKGKLRLGKGGTWFRQTLVVVQFSISVFLIIGSIIIMKQMNYVKTKDLGYNNEQRLLVKVDNDDIYNHLGTFKKELERNENILSASFMSGEPGGFFDVQTYNIEGRTEPWRARASFCDFEYVKTLGLKIIAGRDLSPSFPTDSANAALINRTAAMELGYTPETAVGTWLQNTFRDDQHRRIVGVVEDFNFLSLKQKMEPLVISPGYDKRMGVISIKPGRINSTIDDIRDIYAGAAPIFPFEYSFLDQKFSEMYQKDLRQQTILSIFSGLAIFIACLGLFGLASFATMKRIKEIGVRKVLGSTTNKIIVLLVKDLLKPVLLASVVGIPVAFLFMRSWLQDFAYQTGMQWWIFGLAAGTTILIAMFTVGIKAYRAAVTNPTKSLRMD